MSYLLVGLFFVAVIHFIYEGILAPSLRLEQRFRLFALRDELRRLKIEHRSELDDKHFHYLQDSINNLILALPRFDLATVAAVESKIKTDKELRKRVEGRARVLDDCRIEDAAQIRRRTLRIGSRTLLINSGAWAFYLVPIAVVVACLSEIKRKVKAAVSMSEPDLEKAADGLPPIGLVA